MPGLLDKVWYQSRHPFSRLLQPFSWLYRSVTACRRLVLTHFFQTRFSVPVIVVGNISVGGVGKTPLVIEVAKKAMQQGLKVGIVSRGYGSKIKSFPYEIQANDSSVMVGDEPKLIAESTSCPVVIAPKRVDAIHYMISHHKPDLIISDDGLQHYRMGRTIEIAVIDATRGLGNGLCLPAGPLREPSNRLKQVDFLVANAGNWPNAFSMLLKPTSIIQLTTGKQVEAEFFSEHVAALAGIGNPQRFYSTLTQLGIKFTPHDFPDHYRFQASDFDFEKSLVIMTEKDAVKCRDFATDRMFFLAVHAELSDVFWDALWSHQR